MFVYLYHLIKAKRKGFAIMLYALVLGAFILMILVGYLYSHNIWGIGNNIRDSLRLPG